MGNIVMNSCGDRVCVSVIVPIYRGERYLRQCVESLIAQTYKDIEIILVDDGSPDACPGICDSYARRDRRIKVIHKPNGGLVSARKTGLEASTGEYIGYVDGDDWVEPEMYEDMIAHAVRHGADVVASGHKEELADRVAEVLRNTVACGVYRGDRLVNDIYAKMLYSGKFSQFGIFTYVWNKLFRRSVLFDNQMRVDERIFIGEDAACVYPCLLASKVVCVTDSAHYHYRQWVDSSIKTRGDSQEEIKKLSILHHYLKKRFRESEHAELLLHQLDFFLLSILTVRSDGLMSNGSAQYELCPFKDVKVGGKIVICGAGTFGQHLYRRLQGSRNYQVTGWVDELFAEHRRLGLAVDAPSSIRDMAYDHVVVAFIDETIADEMAKKLSRLGVPAKKIARVSHYEGDVPNLLREFGLEM
jgi:glycosyltransferase involved in cell wall biosynthesis